MDRFTLAYIEAALWSSTGDDGEPLDNSFTWADFSQDALTIIEEECRSFQEDYGRWFVNKEEQAGHDFWLTRVRAGAGFWDGDWPEPAATVLTKATREYGSQYLYVGNDGRLYIQ